MALKTFFTGKTGAKLWTNIALMVLVIVAVPIVTLYLLAEFTHHGEKIEVPSVVGKSVRDAESMLQERGLVAMVTDSAYDKHAQPGAVLEQLPKPGYEVKNGRVIYLTVNLKSAPMVQMPDVVGHGSLREAVSLLQSLGFKLTSHEAIMGRPKDLVIAVKQGNHEVHPGQMLSRDQLLTIVIGGGERDSMMVDEDWDIDGVGDDFDNDF